MGVKNEKLQYKLTKLLVPQQEIVATWWQKIGSTFHITTGYAAPYLYIVNYTPNNRQTFSTLCPKSKGTDFLFKCLLDSPQITSYLLQSMTLGKLHSGSNVSSTDHSSTGSHFP